MAAACAEGAAAEGAAAQHARDSVAALAEAHGADFVWCPAFGAIQDQVLTVPALVPALVPGQRPAASPLAAPPPLFPPAPDSFGVQLSGHAYAGPEQFVQVGTSYQR